jgi:hypothetical protein
MGDDCRSDDRVGDVHQSQAIFPFFEEDHSSREWTFDEERFRESLACSSLVRKIGFSLHGLKRRSAALSS